MRSVRSRLAITAAVAIAATSLALGSGVLSQAGASTSRHVTSSLSRHMHLNCSSSSAFCTEVANSDQVFGHYVGHDEPSTLFYSHKAGSGNHMSYNVTLPVDPSASNPNSVNKSYAFELSGADWFGMAMCDTQSFPEQVKTCPPDSDKNILDPAVSPKHVGEAFMELQFYPPGWVPWPTWAVAVGASSCSKTQWCVALNVDSLSLNPVTGKANNPTCLSKVGEEYVNFAFLTKSGKSLAPANPVDSTLATFTPTSKVAFFNPGDHLTVTLTDTSNGLKTTVHDWTTGATGSMTASKANGFAQVKYDPNGTSCQAIPYNFHPMYNTSSTKTRVTWAAHSYNIAFDSEIGHFQFCNGPVKVPATPFGLLPNGNPTSCPSGDKEGRGVNATAPDGEDIFCFPGSEALLFRVQGCTFTNSGFDGASYQKLWPNGNTMVHPTPFQFSSPKTGPGYTEQYAQTAFEADLPAVESTCNRLTGDGCTLIPQTDQNQPAAFYPFFSITNAGGGGCKWQFGNDIPGEITDFGQNGQYGTLLQQDFTTRGGSTINLYEDFRNVFPNPCPQA